MPQSYKSGPPGPTNWKRVALAGGAAATVVATLNTGVIKFGSDKVSDLLHYVWDRSAGQKSAPITTGSIKPKAPPSELDIYIKCRDGLELERKQAATKVETSKVDYTTCTTSYRSRFLFPQTEEQARAACDAHYRAVVFNEANLRALESRRCRRPNDTATQK